MTTDDEYLLNTGYDEQSFFNSYHNMKYENLKTEINSFCWNHHHKPITINIIKNHFDIPRRLAQIILDELTYKGYLANVQTIHAKFSAYQTIYESDE